MQARSGTYALVMACSSNPKVEVGKLGSLRLQSGFHVYVGSAFGPGGLKARIAHHVKISERPHWHIDYLRPALDLTEIWFTHDSRHREHQWAIPIYFSSIPRHAAPRFAVGCTPS